nr:hypothetical protein [Tanacetum cinerariifolium]
MRRIFNSLKEICARGLGFCWGRVVEVMGEVWVRWRKSRKSGGGSYRDGGKRGASAMSTTNVTKLGCLMVHVGKKITINGSDTTGYDKTKVECFNCHKMGYFAREYRSPRSQESRPRNQDSSRKTVIVEDTSSTSMVAIDGAGFDWSYMADSEVPTNMALMAFSDLKHASSFYIVSFCAFSSSVTGPDISEVEVPSAFAVIL